jgi:hypothetical protein
VSDGLAHYVRLFGVKGFFAMCELCFERSQFRKEFTRTLEPTPALDTHRQLQPSNRETGRARSSTDVALAFAVQPARLAGRAGRRGRHGCLDLAACRRPGSKRICPSGPTFGFRIDIP